MNTKQPDFDVSMNGAATTRAERDFRQAGGKATASRKYDLTDMGNGERFADDHGADVRHCWPWRKWAIWDGRRWRVDDTGAIGRRAKETVRRMYAEAAALTKAAAEAGDEGKATALADAAKKLLAHATKGQDARALSRMLDLARSEPGIPVLPGDFDRNVWLLNVANGTIDLRTGDLHKHRQEDLITKLCPTPYDPDAACPRFLAALDAIFDQDAEVVEFVQLYLGYSLTGDVSEQAIPFWWGAGANGKSTIENAVLDTLGRDYAGMVPVELLMETRASQHPTMLADLFGKRLMFATETGQGHRLNEERLKMLTGGERIKARRMKEDFWEFEPTHKLILITNHKPEVRGTDHAIWRRVRLVPFEVQFLDPDAPEHEGKVIPDNRRMDRGLAGALRTEAPGILAWMVRGCLQWQERGSLPTPAKVRSATKDYRDEQDTIGSFLAECCVTGSPDYSSRASELYARYAKWAESNGETPITKKRLGESLTERGFERRHSGGVLYLGIALNQEQKEGSSFAEAAYS